MERWRSVVPYRPFFACGALAFPSACCSVTTPRRSRRLLGRTSRPDSVAFGTAAIERLKKAGRERNLSVEAETQENVSVAA